VRAEGRGLCKVTGGRVDGFVRQILALSVIDEWKGINFLVQGTLYPDVIESVSFHGGPSSVIKSHHNVGGLPWKAKKLKEKEAVQESLKKKSVNHLLRP
jgi:GMP synthase PP-ATPase subunit